MLLVKTIVKPSTLQGLGLFAKELIPKGTAVWKFNPRFDIEFSVEEVEQMEPLQKDFIKWYAYLSSEHEPSRYILCVDDARFMNHSVSHKNVELVEFPGEIETGYITTRDIQPGEEILTDYTTFDVADAVSNDPYLKQ